MLITFLILFGLAAAAPQLLPGVTIKRPAAAALVAVVFGVLNMFLGLILSVAVHAVTFPFAVMTFGLFWVLVPTIVNTILLKLTDVILEDFKVKGLGALIAMGFLFSIGLWVSDLI